MHHSLVRSCSYWPIAGPVHARCLAPSHPHTQCRAQRHAGSVAVQQRRRPARPCLAQSTSSTVKSDAEAFIEALALEQPDASDASAKDLDALRQKVSELSAKVWWPEGRAMSQTVLHAPT